MLRNEVDTILNEYNDEDGIANVIIETLIRYYSVNGFHHDQFQDNYLKYLKRILAGSQFCFLDKEKLLSYKDQVFSTVMVAVREDLTGKTGTEELYLSSMWQPAALEAILVELFDNRQILSIIIQ